ncbi:MAG: DUF6443 domain-containing protein [Ferruginibacter sp.]
MKHIAPVFLLAYLTTAVTRVVAQPTATRNYVQSTIVKQPGISNESALNNVSIAYNGKAQSITYVDGLGRPVQTVVTKGSPTQKDMISLVEYDPLGREIKKYLPYTDLSSTSYGSFKTDWAPKQPVFYNGQLAGVQPDLMPYAQILLETSPLNRPIAQGAPGLAWQPNMADAYDITKKTVRIKYETNVAADNIVIWNVANPGINFDITQITRNGYYAGGLLSVKHIWDEHGNETEEYTDKDGHIILKKVQDGIGTWADTYYIYDDFGRLRAVIQPNGVSSLPTTLDNTFAANWMFQYRYDERGRMVMKKVPGADSVVMMYDQWDRLVLTQDGVQRAKANKEFLFTKYDYMNRPIMTGVYVNNSAHNTIRDLVMASNTRNENINSAATEGYSLNLSFPTSYQELLTIMHYDNYNNLPSWKSNYAFVSENGNTTYNTFITGEVIASQTKVLGTSTWLKTITYYDEEYRPIQVYGDNIKGGKDRITSQLLWDGKPIEQWQSHTSTFYSIALVVKKKFTYDHADRVLIVKHQINSQEEVTIAANSYNEIGQPLNKKLHISASRPAELQKLDYGYNIRGWLINMNRVENTAGVTTYEAADLFAFELGYNTTTLTGATAQYNGNISEQKWKGPFAETPNGYIYTYDKMNRLLSSVSSNKAGASWVVDNKFDEKNITYNKNGNILTLTRHENGSVMDNLTYAYSGNRLTKVEDGGDVSLGFKNGSNLLTEYTYDANGSMYIDKNKGINNIVYNHLNLPASITITTKGTISYLYDANGNKLRKVVYDSASTKSDTTWYAGAMIYAKDTLQLMMQDEGRIRPVKINVNAAGSAANFKYVYDYFLKDHLGNIRLVATTESNTMQYNATMEPGNSVVEDSTFSNVSSTASPKPNGFDNIRANTKVSKLHGDINTAGNKRTGPSIILKVMAGDTISVSTYAWYTGTVQAPPGGVSSIATELINALTGGIVEMGGGKAGVNSITYITGLSTSAVNNFLTNSQSYNNTRPKAFLNWMVLDEQFASVGSANHLGTVQVPTITAGGMKQQLVGPVNMVVQKSGYLYVYVSNESNMNVYFDDIVVNHKTGPVLEVTNYRALGTRAESICSKAAGCLRNLFQFNGGNELQSVEFGEGNGLEIYDAVNRLYDPQLGRFFQQDELAESHWEMTPYNFTANNPIRFNDPLGLEEGDPNKPKNLPVVVVKSVKKLSHNQMQSLYWDFRRRNIGFDHLNPALRVRLERWDGIARHMEEVHEMARESDIAFLNLASWFIPGTQVMKLRYLKVAVKLFKSKRVASAGADALMQYINNAPKNGWGMNNISKINITSVAFSAAMPSSNWAAGYGSASFEINLDKGYLGIGQSSNSKSMLGVFFEGTVNTGGNIIGNKFGNATSTRLKWSEAMSEGTGNVIGNSISNTSQTIFNELNKPNE